MVTAKKLLCICQICTCGRHHCVHRPQTNVKPKGECVASEYQETYRKFSNYEVQRAVVPDSSQHMSDQPFDGNTSYKEVFVPHDIQARSRREQPKYVRPEGTFEGVSSYQNDYFEKAPDKVHSAKPHYHPATYDKPFDGTTVHQETYRPWEKLPSAHKFRPPKAAIRIPSGRFDHKSTFQADYLGHKGHAGRETIQPPEPTLSVGAGKIADETTTRADYTKKSIAPERSARPVQNPVLHTDPFDHNTTAKDAYKWPSGRPADSCKPDQVPKQSMEPFESDTTHNATYRAWKVPRRATWKPSTGWTAPTDAFDHKTTFQRDFSQKQGSPAKSARPDYFRPAPGDFDGVTTHKEAFQPWSPGPRQSYRPTSTNAAPKVKFDGESTFQSDFKGFPNTRPDLCIPKEGGVGFVGPQEFSTSYKDTFVGEKLPTCPAKYLELRQSVPSRNGYTYADDRNGHQFFAAPDLHRESVEILAL